MKSTEPGEIARFWGRMNNGTGRGIEPQKEAIKNRRLLQRMAKIEKLKKTDQQALFRTIDMFLKE
ncbi:hypothetical protein KAI87_06455 [Myxococcota bacterium]|nr:hypothetical protein [Myxococcota bacterium]